MKLSKLSTVAIAVLLVISLSLLHVPAAGAQNQGLGSYEYATIRWAGRENTHIVRPDGKVEFVGEKLDKIAKPNSADDRAFYMNIVMNGLSKEGYEFAGISNDDIIMKRPASH